jgi:hypothetical protein
MNRTHIARGLAALPENKQALVTEIVCALAGIAGVEAVVLGGSFARGVARPDSDVDLGIYYREAAPLAPTAVTEVAQRFAVQEPTVTALYEWGPWVNGGAWVETEAGEVDLLYRNIDQVHRVIDDAQHGRVEWHFGQQPPYGFHSVIYLAETQACVPVHDPHGVLAVLKRAVAVYPPALRTKLVAEFLWGAEFTLFLGRKFAAAGDVYNTVGCMTRALSQLTQVLFALNQVYFITDKGALETIDVLPVRPHGYGATVGAILAQPGATAAELSASVQRLETLTAEVIALSGSFYRPRYQLSRVDPE